MKFTIDQRKHLNQRERAYLGNRYYHYKKLKSLHKEVKSWYLLTKIFEYELELSRKSREGTRKIFRDLNTKQLIRILQNRIEKLELKVFGN